MSLYSSCTEIEMKYTSLSGKLREMESPLPSWKIMGNVSVSLKFPQLKIVKFQRFLQCICLSKNEKGNVINSVNIVKTLSLYRRYVFQF